MAVKKAIQSRLLKSYPPPKYRDLTFAYASQNDTSASKVVITALKQFFNTMPAEQREQLLSKNNY